MSIMCQCIANSPFCCICTTSPSSVICLPVQCNYMAHVVLSYNIKGKKLIITWKIRNFDWSSCAHNVIFNDTKNNRHIWILKYIFCPITGSSAELKISTMKGSFYLSPLWKLKVRAQALLHLCYGLFAAFRVTVQKGAVLLYKPLKNFTAAVWNNSVSIITSGMFPHSNKNYMWAQMFGLAGFVFWAHSSAEFIT